MVRLLEKEQFKRCLLVESKRCSCYICGTWRSKEVGGLKSSYGKNGGGWGDQTTKKGQFLWAEFTPLLVYMNYPPISTPVGIKRVLWYALHNIPSCQNFISTRQLGESLNQVFSLDLHLGILLIFFLSICKCQLNESLLF